MILISRPRRDAAMHVSRATRPRALLYGGGFDDAMRWLGRADEVLCEGDRRLVDQTKLGPLMLRVRGQEWGLGKLEGIAGYQIRPCPGLATLPAKHQRYPASLCCTSVQRSSPPSLAPEIDAFHIRFVSAPAAGPGENPGPKFGCRSFIDCVGAGKLGAVGWIQCLPGAWVNLCVQCPRLALLALSLELVPESPYCTTKR